MANLCQSCSSTDTYTIVKDNPFKLTIQTITVCATCWAAHGHDDVTQLDRETHKLFRQRKAEKGRYLGTVGQFLMEEDSE